MAKTTREKKVEPVIEEQAPTKKVLASGDLLALETGSRDVQKAQLYMALEEQALRNMILESELLALKIEKQKARLQSLAREYTNEQQKYGGLKEELFKSYGIVDGKLGYDSTSGEII